MAILVSVESGVAAREQLRAKLQAEVDAFLSSGGTIRQMGTTDSVTMDMKNNFSINNKDDGSGKKKNKKSMKGNAKKPTSNKSNCTTIGPTCRGCPDCQSGVGDDATNEACRLEQENNHG